MACLIEDVGARDGDAQSRDAQKPQRLWGRREDK
jgi:hypothetical protein